MIGMLMQMLDITIANVAMPHMQAALGASPDTVTWVLSSYVVMSAIATPLTGWLEGRLGRRNLFTIAMLGFTISSAACGFASSLPLMVAARAVQGTFGALIAPLAQSTMMNASPREKQAQAIMLFGMGVMVGPVIGPLLGGWLTEQFDWRWVFFVNVPFGLATTLGTFFLLDRGEAPMQRFDKFGFTVLAIGLAAIQLLLDRGPQLDWFDSPEVVVETCVAIGAMWMFGVHISSARNPILSLALLRDRNYTVSTLFVIMVTAIALSCQTLLAPVLQTLMGYDVMGAGWMMAPRGVGAVFAMPLVTVLSRRIDQRYLVGAGICMVAYSLSIMSGFTIETPKMTIIWSTVLQGVAVGFIFLPLNIMAYSTIAPVLRTEAASFFSLARNIAGSAGISFMSLMLARNVQINHSELAGHVTSARMTAMSYIDQMQYDLPRGLIARMLDAEINRQAVMIAYIDNFWMMMWGCLLMLPLIALMTRSRKREAGPTVMME